MRLGQSNLPNNRRALVVHGYRGNPYVNWYPWLARKLRKAGYQTWAPWMPFSSMPDGKRWTKKLLSKSNWDYNGCLVVGHSAGAVELLNLLQALPEGQKVEKAVLVSSFRANPNWLALTNLFYQKFDYEKIKNSAEEIIIVHSANDPLCPVEDAEFYAKKLKAELVILPDGGHFTILKNPKFWRFPRLLEIISPKLID